MSETILKAIYNKYNTTLMIEYINGNRYEYYDVPENIGNGIIWADNAGIYLANHIKGSYRYQRID